MAFMALYLVYFYKAKLSNNRVYQKLKIRHMKRGIYIVLATLFVGTSLISQTSEVEEDLKILYADEDYQKCAHKALKYSEGKYKNDPIVYIYASMACLRMSQDHEAAEKFPKAFTDALSYATKYRKKDKTGAIYEQYIRHFEELKKIVAEEIDNYLLEDNKDKVYKAVKKSVGLLKKINAMDPEDKGAMLLRGLLEIQAQNAMEGKSIIKEYLPVIKEIKATRAEMPVVEQPAEEEGDDKKKKKKDDDEISPIKPFEEMSEMEQVHLRMALMGYANYLHKKGQTDEAKEIIEIGKPYFYGENEMYQRKYDTKYKALYMQINS